MRSLGDPGAGTDGHGQDDVAVSVVIPCLNEEKAIGRVVRKALAGFAQAGVTGEVLVVDNGSLDSSVAEARRAGARVVFEARRGYGNALRRGFAEARGRYILMADGDDTYPVDNLSPFLGLLESGCDMVNGNRFGGPMEPGAMTWSHRYLGTPLLSWILRWFTGANLSDSQCGMRAFRRSILEQLDLRASGMEFASEMLVKAARAGLKIGQVPIVLMPRVGDSKLQTLPDGWRHLRYLLVASPDHLFLLPGVGLFLLGLGMLVVQALVPAGLWISGSHWQPRYASVILGAVGAQVLWFGLLAKIYYAGSGLTDGDWLVRWYLRSFSLERSIALSLVVCGLGIALEVALALQQVGLVEAQPVIGAAGAFATVVGLQSFFSSFMAYLMSSEYTSLSARQRSPRGETAVAVDMAGENQLPA